MGPRRLCIHAMILNRKTMPRISAVGGHDSPDDEHLDDVWSQY